MGMELKKFFQSQEYQAIEHMLKIAVFWGISAFVTELSALLLNDHTIANFAAAHPSALIVLMVVNMILAGLKKYADLKKAQ